MPRLIKSVEVAYIPGRPGITADVARGGYWSFEEVQTCGYTSPNAPLFVAGPNIWYQCTTNSVLIYHPPVVGSPGIPSAPPTPAQIKISLNEGWNSYARTIGALAAGSYINYTIKYGTKGALLAVAYSGFEGRPIGEFTHGVMVDISGIRVFESGVVVATLAPPLPGRNIRIARLADGRIVYAVDSGVFHVSSAPVYPSAAELYVYGMLYSGYDEVSTAEFISGNILSEASAKLSGAGSLSAQPTQDVEAALSGAGALVASASPSATMAGLGALTALIQNATLSAAGSLTGLAKIEQLVEATMLGVAAPILAAATVGGRGSGSLPVLAGLGGDTAYAQGRSTLPFFTSGASNGGAAYVPPEITRGYANLPFIVGAALGIDIDHGAGVGPLPRLAALGGDYPYGFGYATLPYYAGLAFGGFIPDDEISLVSPALVSASIDPQIDVVLVFTSTGQLESAQAMTRLQALEMLSAMQAASMLDMLGVYGYSLLSTARGLSIQTLNIGDRPDLNDTGVVWVVNRETGASSQYEQYGFNSFFQRGAEYYGVANDGIYLLDGNTDAGSPISALVETGRTNLGYTNEKRLSRVYLGVGSDKELYLKVDVDNQTYVYSMRTSGQAVKNRPVEIGWGVKGDYWDFTLVNPDGADFNLASISFTPIPLARRG